MQKGHYPFFTFCDNRLKDIITPEVNIIDASVMTSFRISPPSSSVTTATNGATNNILDSLPYCYEEDDDDGFVVLDYASESSPRR